MNETIYQSLKEKISEKTYYEDVPDSIWEIFETNKHRITKQDYSKIKIGLLNIPCNGFGDIITCYTFYNYLKEWYPGIKVTIYTTDKSKFASLGIKGNIKELLIRKCKVQYDGSECSDLCPSFYQLRFKNKQEIPILDLLLVCPCTSDLPFDIKDIQTLFPYANLFNTYTLSEYNGVNPPYTFNPGLGEGTFGLFLTDMKITKHDLVKSPYALVYIAESGRTEPGEYQTPMLHSHLCILCFIEMISKKYIHKYKRFTVIVPSWVIDRLDDYPGFRSKFSKSTKSYPTVSYMKDKNEKYLRQSDKRGELIIRGDILPVKRELFISLVKYSVEDVLVTGDQSITDAISYCPNQKNIWYQVVPWKQEFAYELSKIIPNKFLSDFRTSCGTLKGIRFHKNNQVLRKHWDFRKLGKQRMDSLLLSRKIISSELGKSIVSFYDSSRKVSSYVDKIDKLKNKMY